MYNCSEILPRELVELYQSDHVLNNAFRLCFSKELSKEETLIEVIKLLCKYNNELTKIYIEYFASQPPKTIFMKP